MKLKLVFILFISFKVLAQPFQQNLSTDAEISVLTIGPGTSLNDSFGHNAYRIKDKTNNIDLVFNYGVYDFDTPNFYTKFAQGKLNYLIGLNYYDDFYDIYSSQNRAIKEQVLNLSQIEKQQIFDYLLVNFKPKNRAYLYDFFFDNCATKIRDVLKDVMKDNVTFNDPDGFEQENFRYLIQDNLHWNSWGSFGIDLALGAVIDKKASGYEHMFLPEYIYQFFENATIQGSNQGLVKQTKTLYKKIIRPQSNNFLTSPIIVFGGFSIIILVFTYLDHKKNRHTRWLDIILFTFTGIIGVIILLLWFATDHKATAHNYNLLWACALNILVIRQFFKQEVSRWFIKYLKFLVVILCLLLLHWIVGVQSFALGLIPLITALFIRYVYLIKYFGKITE